MTNLPKYLTHDDLKRFFAAIDSPHDKVLDVPIYHYWLRAGEALMFTIDDVSFKLAFIQLCSRAQRFCQTLKEGVWDFHFLSLCT